MNIQEARQLIPDELGIYERKSYTELVQLVDGNLKYKKRGPSGTSYQIEILILWDAKPGGAVRVIGSIDDGGWRACLPLTGSLLKAPVE